MYSLSFVIPVYNEELRLTKTFDALTKLTLPKKLKLLEIIFVDDGSTDKTKLKIQRFTSSWKGKAAIRLLSYPTNRGKGYALRFGAAKAKADYMVFFDADMSVKLSELSKTVAFMQKGYSLIVGTRKLKNSRVLQHQSKQREILGQIFVRVSQCILQINATDVTCGFKVFAKRTKPLFLASSIDRWGYDAELLLLAQKENLSIAEIPVTWSNDPRSKVILMQAILTTAQELVSILWVHKWKPLLYSTNSYLLSPLQLAGRITSNE